MKLKIYLTISAIICNTTFYSVFAQEKKNDNLKPAIANWHIPDLSSVIADKDSLKDYTEIRDEIPIRGTKFLIRVPKKWNPDSFCEYL